MIRQRIISAVILAALLIVAVLWLPALASTIALSAVLLLAAWEWSAFPAGANLRVRLVFVVIVLAASAGLWCATATSSGLRLTLDAAIVFWTAAMIWIALLPRKVNRVLVYCVGVGALSLAWVTLARMRIDWAEGRFWVMYALLVVWIADSGAYFAGRAWGVSKLAPLVSPGKTWAGLWGGLAATALLALIVAQLTHRPALPLIELTLLVGVYSVVGDLTESLCKRFAGLKDSGAVIPGHGGVLDRFDSLLAALPCMMWGVIQFGTSAS
jgi:phosphatidate cytidylyltransferase